MVATRERIVAWIPAASLKAGTITVTGAGPDHPGAWLLRRVPPLVRWACTPASTMKKPNRPRVSAPAVNSAHRSTSVKVSEARWATFSAAPANRSTPPAGRWADGMPIAWVTVTAR